MRILILGGTIFLGRHLVATAVSRGHQLTLFNRGRHYPDDFPEVERLVGDRSGETNALRGRSWDAVIDTSGNVPKVVQKSAEVLAGAAGHYTFVSTVFAYHDFPRVAGLDENAPLTTAADADSERVSADKVGPLKVACEQVLQHAFGRNLLLVRAGFIFGPYDPTDRSGYWVRRVSEGGEVLAPGAPDRQVQLVDVRDLAEWMIRSVEANRLGAFNVTGPGYPSTLTLGRLLDVCKSQVKSSSITRNGAHFTWVMDDLLRTAGVRPGIDLPFWMPGGVAGVNCNKAITAGLTVRPIEETVRYTMAWYNNRETTPLRAGITRDRETQLLRAWHSQSGEPVA